MCSSCALAVACARVHTCVLVRAWCSMQRVGCSCPWPAVSHRITSVDAAFHHARRATATPSRERFAVVPTLRYVQAFKIRALQTHPDQNPDENTHHLFQQVCRCHPGRSLSHACRNRGP